MACENTGLAVGLKPGVKNAKNYRSGLRIKSALDIENRNRTATC